MYASFVEVYASLCKQNNLFYSNYILHLRNQLNGGVHSLKGRCGSGVSRKRPYVEEIPCPVIFFTEEETFLDQYSKKRQPAI